MQEAPIGTLGEHNAAFVAIACRSMQPYLHYDQPISGPKDQTIPRVLLLLRWDGLIGFPGGVVDPGETPIQAAVREVEEEIGLILRADELAPACVFIDDEKRFASHLFLMETDPARFRVAVRGAGEAEHAEAETCGILTPNLIRSTSGRGLDSILSLPFAHTAGLELRVLIDRFHLAVDAPF